MRIADYEPQQAREIVALWRASFEHGMGMVDEHPIEQQFKAFEDKVVPHHRVRVAVEGSAILAFMASTPEMIDQIFVRVENIGQGLGTRLLDLAKAESTGSLWLYTFVRNANARRFYERHGFTEVERDSENMWKLEAIRYEWQRPALPASR